MKELKPVNATELNNIITKFLDSRGYRRMVYAEASPLAIPGTYRTNWVVGDVQFLRSVLITDDGLSIRHTTIPSLNKKSNFMQRALSYMNTFIPLSDIKTKTQDCHPEGMTIFLHFGKELCMLLSQSNQLVKYTSPSF